ncbi:MAG: hypothetical protein M1820_000875 [Bogoriella megaspora]|nr:MAG: hypothetical protein M1820_000875 [Bogoriella megaspora]
MTSSNSNSWMMKLEMLAAKKWSALLEANISRTDGPIDEAILQAPRRRSARTSDAELAYNIARLLFPCSDEDSLQPIIRYEKCIVNLRARVMAQRRAATEEATKHNNVAKWSERIASQGPWDEVVDRVSLKGTPALPMPVRISSEDDLKPFFEHLQANTCGKMTPIEGGVLGEEPSYGVPMIEFRKGVEYEDGRLDLCKMVVGEPHIGALMNSLRTNTSISHFLLGNNIIGSVGAKEISAFVKELPDKMETWYLAGNCINEASFKSLVHSLVTSEKVNNIWLKRNPLGPWSAHEVFRLITKTKNLRTLDLDHTELGDAGVAQLFKELAAHCATDDIPLRNLYLAANGISTSAAGEISAFLASPHCQLEALYLSYNPLGDAGATALASQLDKNVSLKRLSLQSCGLKDAGLKLIFSSLSHHPKLRTLDVGTGYATIDLDARFNYITALSAPEITNFISASQGLEYLDLGYTAIPTTALPDPNDVPSDLYTVLSTVSHSRTLLYFNAKPATSAFANSFYISARAAAADRLRENVARRFDEMGYGTFLEDEKRWLVSPEDVRKIDSVYRNRDAGKARRGEMVLDKWWDDEDEKEAWEVVRESREGL